MKIVDKIKEEVAPIKLELLVTVIGILILIGSVTATA